MRNWIRRPVDFAAQKVIASTHVDGWEAFDLVREIQNRFGTPVVIDRDSMAGALGEGYFGGRPRLPAAFLS
jgi:predicted NBD/HSP70 family sugar kinase